MLLFIVSTLDVDVVEHTSDPFQILLLRTHTRHLFVAVALSHATRALLETGLLN